LPTNPPASSTPPPPRRSSACLRDLVRAEGTTCVVVTHDELVERSPTASSTSRTGGRSRNASVVRARLRCRSAMPRAGWRPPCPNRRPVVIRGPTR
jgi:hypothetical protein